MILFSAGIVSLRPEVGGYGFIKITTWDSFLVLLWLQVDLALEDQDKFFIDLINWDLNTARTSRQRLATSHIISSIMNKRVMSA